jgi:hypothetical protein
MVKENVSQLHASFIEKWVAELPPTIAVLKEEYAPMELVVSIIPGKPEASSVIFRLGDYNGFGLYFGYGFSFEEMDWPNELILDVLDSVRRGHFHEKIWEWHGRILRSEGQLILKSGMVLSDKGCNNLLGLLPFGTVRDMQYAPWD